MKTLVAVAFVSMVMLGGCVQSGTPEVDAAATRYVMSTQSGVITDARAVVVKGEGGGALLGGITGGVLGSTMGGGRGSVLTTLAGGLIGMYAGNELSKSNAQELTVMLDNKEEVVVVSIGTTFGVGERIKIVKRDGRIYNVEAAKPRP
ncbi:MAG: glycine zipper 2TM domain-containing protein [Sulfurimonas sp.]|uniref:glycine zipper 2TM domain-containing protein n=1 Tax=Sulfurimonas sp. TaxID=2022749 RepID=UPI002619D150|nr:glycine zipper 2TM domain-containing protein [Sulfurimonas sp.]MDD2653464.1 glycine zipper 2TM domain-containing protein [Sulfurimonas sp.]MDD3450478.1 glycine zipper 2TM domain-containing protein [Sulfurimonas sp.]